MTPEEYKVEQKKRLSSFKVGGIDPNGYHITKIFARGDEYIIYEIEINELIESLKVYVDNVTEKDDSGIIQRYNSIRKKFVEVKRLLYKVVDKTSIKAIIAQLVVHGIRSNADEANKEFDKLIDEINEEYKEQFANRVKLLSSSLILSVVFIILAIVIYYYDFFINNIHIRNLFFVSAAGSMGGLFSLSSGLKKIICEKGVPAYLYIIYGVERIIIAILASTIIYFAIKAEVIFGTCNTMDSPLIGYVLFSFLAGFSETLVPNLMTKLEKE